MPSKVQKKRAQNKKYYKDHKEKLSLQACENYAANSDVKNSPQKNILKLINRKGCHTIASIMKLIRIRG